MFDPYKTGKKVVGTNLEIPVEKPAPSSEKLFQQQC
jgi:hypothetical protein